MPNVSFTLKTFGLETTRSLRAQVVFTPSTSGAIGPDGILIRRVVVPFEHINAETGLATVELAQTTFLRPSTHYIVSVEWLDGAPAGWAEINWPLQVPEAGGPLSELLTIPWPLGALAISPIPPNGTVDIDGLWVDNSKEPAILMRKIGATSWVEMAVLGALGDPAAANLILNDTLTRAAVDSRIAGIAADIIASDPTITEAAAEAIAGALADEWVLVSQTVVPEHPGDEGFMGDKVGKLSKVGFDVNGEVAEATMRSIEGKGGLRIQVKDAGIVFQDELTGRTLALDFDASGQFGERTHWALVNLKHRHKGPDRPFVFPGNYVIWERTDELDRVISKQRIEVIL